MQVAEVDQLAGLLDQVVEADRRRQRLDGTRRAEKVIETALARSFKRQGRLFVAELALVRAMFPTEMPTEALRDKDWRPLWQRAARESSPEMVRAITGGIEIAMEAGGKALLAHLNASTSFSLKNPRAVAYIRQRGAMLVGTVNDTTRNYIRTLMTEAVDKGWSYSYTARVLKGRFAEFAVGNPLLHIRSRAELISVTESAFAYEQGNLQAVGQLVDDGVPIEKSWITVGDERVDEEACGPNEDAGWMPLDETFPDGSDVPPAHPGCRCTAGYRVTGAEVGA